jgi:hypothetical protein
MNCKPGDLAIITGLHPAVDAANGRIVRLADAAPVSVNGEPAWILAERVEVVLLANGRSFNQQFWIGETVWFDRLQDKYLRPIRDSDGEDEMLRLAGKPSTADRITAMRQALKRPRLDVSEVPQQ